MNSLCSPAGCLCHAHNGFLTRRGYALLAEAEQRPQVDRVGSVSALVEVEEDLEYDALHIELNGRYARSPQISFSFSRGG